MQVSHFAGPIVYSALSFIEKNVDQLSNECRVLLGDNTSIIMILLLSLSLYFRFHHHYFIRNFEESRFKC